MRSPGSWRSPCASAPVPFDRRCFGVAALQLRPEGHRSAFTNDPPGLIFESEGTRRCWSSENRFSYCAISRRACASVTQPCSSALAKALRRVSEPHTLPRTFARRVASSANVPVISAESALAPPETAATTTPASHPPRSCAGTSGLCLKCRAAGGQPICKVRSRPAQVVEVGAGVQQLRPVHAAT